MASRRIVTVKPIDEFDGTIDDALDDGRKILVLQMSRLKHTADNQRLLTEDELSRLDAVIRQLLAIKKLKPEGIPMSVVMDLDLTPLQVAKLEALLK